MNWDPSLFVTDYIWTPDWTAQDDRAARIVCFRRALSLSGGEAERGGKFRITADSRYKLYVNGRFVQEGPQKALDLREWYVDDADISAFLREGENVLAVEVLRYPPANYSSAQPVSNDSLYRTEIPFLCISEETGTNKPRFHTRAGWKCRVNRGIRIFGEDARPAPIQAQEAVQDQGAFAGWKKAGFDDTGWDDPVPKLTFDLPAADAPGCLIPRTIPPMRHEDRRFTGVVCLRDPKDPDRPLQAPEEENAWNRMLAGGEPVAIPSNTTQIIEISAGAEECGYLLYAFAGGGGAQVDTLCSEAYAYPVEGSPDNPLPPLPRKGDRTDWHGGRLYGSTSTCLVSGFGSPERPEAYEPFWFRTFRFLRLTITTQDAPLQVLALSYRETGYPLNVRTAFTSSDPTLPPIWEISVRTLRRCMHETYFDCPFYEQLQYAMDSRNEILCTYALSADDRLARQAMEAFRLSQRPDGMIGAAAPEVKSNPIPSFAIYYLLMVYDHMMYFGDRELVRRNLPAIDGILHFFDVHLAPNGLVRHVGGPLLRDRYWSFIDWSTKWNRYSGVPNAVAKGSGSLTMESLLYLYGLQKAAALASFVGRDGLAAEYQKRGEALKAAIQRECFGTWEDEKKIPHRLVQDGPGVPDYSVHCQVFAILTGTVSAKEGREMLLATVGNKDLAQASVSFMFYLFRAMEMAGCYDLTNRQWDLWRQMVQDHMTTCVENDTDARSDCHGWSALLCYEMPAVILGVRPAAPGFSRVRIAPQMAWLSHAAGDVITPKGMVHVSWRRTKEGTCKIEKRLPEGLTEI
ncbi:MAG: alpha-L-rhamnosidase C-terminal domain-containing protein [Lachnospiraceae bacterium]